MTINPLVGIVTLLAEEVDVLGKLSFHVVEVSILILLIVEILSEFLKRGGHNLEGIYELQRSDGEAQELLVVVGNRTEASLLTKLVINLVGSSDDKVTVVVSQVVHHDREEAVGEIIDVAFVVSSTSKFTSLMVVVTNLLILIILRVKGLLTDMTALRFLEGLPIRFLHDHSLVFLHFLDAILRDTLQL